MEKREKSFKPNKKRRKEIWETILKALEIVYTKMPSHPGICDNLALAKVRRVISEKEEEWACDQVKDIFYPGYRYTSYIWDIVPDEIRDKKTIILNCDAFNHRVIALGFLIAMES
jgi:hypothetical protein